MGRSRVKVLVFTGSRGEWGYLRPVLSSLQTKGVNFGIIVSNMHIDPMYGNTSQEIINDGFDIYEKIPMNISYDSDFSWCRSLGLLASQIPSALERFKPDLILLAGDRAETMIFASLSYYTQIPIAHIQAGELSGHKDGMARHAISKLVHIHFASNQDAYDRLIRLGEQPFRIHLTGAPQIDDLMDEQFVRKGENIKEYLKIEETEQFCLCIFHACSDDEIKLSEKIKEIDGIINDKGIMRIWVLPNNDLGSPEIESEIMKLNKLQVRIAKNLPRSQYAYLLKKCKFIIGNSSSGILEAPIVGTPSINIGNRQKGRLQAPSVSQFTYYNIIELRKIIEIVFNTKYTPSSFYGLGRSGEAITDILLKEDLKSKKLINKYLHEEI